jgi:hypothetical protein
MIIICLLRTPKTSKSIAQVLDSSYLHYLHEIFPYQNYSLSPRQNWNVVTSGIRQPMRQTSATQSDRFTSKADPCKSPTTRLFFQMYTLLGTLASQVAQAMMLCLLELAVCSMCTWRKASALKAILERLTHGNSSHAFTSRGGHDQCIGTMPHSESSMKEVDGSILTSYRYDLSTFTKCALCRIPVLRIL